MTSLFSYLKKYKRLVFLHIVFNILLSIFTVISIPLLIPFFKILFKQEATNNASEGSLEFWLNEKFASLIETYGDQTALLLVCTTIVIVFFFKNLSRYLALYFITPVRNGIVYDIRGKVFQKFMRLPLSFFSQSKKGDLITRSTSDIQEIEWSILNVLESIFKAPIIIIGCVLFMFSISTKLILFGLGLMVFTGVVIGVLAKKLRTVSSAAQGRLGSITSTIEEALSGMRIIRAFNAESYSTEKFEEDNKEYRDLSIKLLRRKDSSSPLSEFLGVSIVAILLYFGTKLVLQNEISPETFFAFIFAFYQVIEPSKSFANAYYNVQKGLAAKERIDGILDAPEDTYLTSRGTQQASFDNKIDICDLSMQYDNSNDLALNCVSLTIKKGETVALVGPSGGGKTTLADVVCMFYPYQSGSILVDNVELKDIDVHSWREKIGLVNQEAILFNDSFENNIHFGSGIVDNQRVISASVAANAQEFIQETSNGYKHMIGDNGGNLSGGQRQRLTIARALYKDPELLILDEATSALDSESERLVQDSLDHLMEGRTSIVIAHRLSTIKKADKIYVMQDGQIVESGKHSELMENKNTYYKLVQMQTFTS